MPRGPRLDVPGALHHVMARGLERRSIFLTDDDRAEFVVRMARAARVTGTRVYAWALLPNHSHLLVQSGERGLSAMTRRLLTGYAGYFNRRRRRRGHLFQNRGVLENNDWKDQLWSRGNPRLRLERLTAEIASRFEVAPGARMRAVTRARAVLCYVAIGHAGLSTTLVAQAVGITPRGALARAIAGQRLASELGIDAVALLCPPYAQSTPNGCA